LLDFDLQGMIILLSALKRRIVQKMASTLILEALVTDLSDF